MNTRLLSLLSLSVVCAAAAEARTADMPVADSTYYVYNVGAGKYLSADGAGSFTLTDDVSLATAITLTAVETTAGDGSDEGFLRLTTPEGGALSSSFGGALCSDGGEIYDQWLVEESAVDSCFVIALRVKEANTFMNIRWDEAYERIEKSAVVPGATFAGALWQFVTGTDEAPDEGTTAVEAVADTAASGSDAAAVYTLAGRKAAHNADASLPRGVYIVGGRKVIVH